MKKLFFLLILFISLLPASLSAAEEPARKPRCCQVTLENGNTQCRERESNCSKGTNDPDGEYILFDTESTCTSKSDLRTVFGPGHCTSSVLDSNAVNDLEVVGTKAGYSAEQKGANALTNYIGKIIKFSLSITGLIFLVYTIYSGFQWMTASGNSNQVSEARTRLIQSAIGMTITAVAYTAAVLIIKIIGGQS